MERAKREADRKLAKLSKQPNQTTMNQYKAITRVPHISEPFVDWYDAETEEQARTMWEADAREYGTPMDSIVTFEKQ